MLIHTIASNANRRTNLVKIYKNMGNFSHEPDLQRDKLIDKEFSKSPHHQKPTKKKNKNKKKT